MKIFCLAVAVVFGCAMVMDVHAHSGGTIGGQKNGCHRGSSGSAQPGFHCHPGRKPTGSFIPPGSNINAPPPPPDCECDNTLKIIGYIVGGATVLWIIGEMIEDNDQYLIEEKKEMQWDIKTSPDSIKLQYNIPIDF